MRFGHVAHDRQPEAEAAMRAAARFVQPREAVEDAVQSVLGQTRSVVFDRQTRVCAIALEEHPHGARLLGGIAQRVLQEVADDLTQSLFVTGHHHRLVVHLDACGVRGGQSRDNRVDHEVQPHGCPLGTDALTDFREPEEIIDESAQAADFLTRVGQHLGTVRLGQVALEEFQVAADRGQGCAQLMRRVRDQLPLGGQHPIHARDELIEDARQGSGVSVAHVLVQAMREVAARGHFGSRGDNEGHPAQDASAEPSRPAMPRRRPRRRPAPGRVGHAR